jgi:hypothetical protein
MITQSGYHHWLFLDWIGYFWMLSGNGRTKKDDILQVVVIKTTSVHRSFFLTPHEMAANTMNIQRGYGSE